jgi:mRNA-degrading endonuclease RelE of RelBE toxin-antitoxin system
MKHFIVDSFYKYYYNLPKYIQDLTDKNLKLLKENSKHPSLHFKKVGKYYSFRIGLNYRAL